MSPTAGSCWQLKDQLRCVKNVDGRGVRPTLRCAGDRSRVVVEMPTGGLPVGMNPAMPLLTRQVGFAGIVADVLDNSPQVFLIAHNAIVRLFLPQRTSTSHSMSRPAAAVN